MRYKKFLERYTSKTWWKRYEGEVGASNYETEYHCRPVEAGHRAVSWENNKSRLQSSGPDHESALKESSFSNRTGKRHFCVEPLDWVVCALGNSGSVSDETNKGEPKIGY